MHTTTNTTTTDDGRIGLVGRYLDTRNFECSGTVHERDRRVARRASGTLHDKGSSIVALSKWEFIVANHTLE